MSEIHPEDAAARPNKDLAWTAGCVILNLAVGTTVNKYGSGWSGWIVVALWVLALIPFGIWLWNRERLLLTRGWISEKFKQHPISYFMIVVMFGFVLFNTGSHLFRRQWKPPVEKTEIPQRTPPKTPTAAVLIPTPKAKESKPPSSRQRRAETPSSLVVTSNTPPQQTVARQAAPTQQCTAGSQCNVATNGGTVTNPTVINFKDPPPQVLIKSIRPLAAVPPFESIPGEPESQREMRAMRYNSSLGFERRNKNLTSTPGLEIAFTVSSSFVGAKFNVGCDNPCEITSESTNVSDGETSSSMNGIPSVLTSGPIVVITVRSSDPARPVSTATISPIVE